jgi:hypothetical protein
MFSAFPKTAANKKTPPSRSCCVIGFRAAHGTSSRYRRQVISPQNGSIEAAGEPVAGLNHGCVVTDKLGKKRASAEQGDDNGVFKAMALPLL